MVLIIRDVLGLSIFCLSVLVVNIAVRNAKIIPINRDIKFDTRLFLLIKGERTALKNIIALGFERFIKSPFL